MIEPDSIICGHNIDIMKQIDDCSIELTVTSPPYDNLRDYQGYDFQFEPLARELFRVTKQGGVVVWVVGDATIKGSETGTSFKQALYFKEIGFNLHDTMIYRKINYLPLTHNRYDQEFEYMFVLSKGIISTFNPIKILSKFGGCEKDWNSKKNIKEQTARVRNEVTIIGNEKLKANIWSYPIGNIGTDVNDHPAPFPEKLAQDHILSWSNEGDTVLEPMCGSGTTCKMAYKLNRKYIGIDCSENYCRIAEQRIADEKRQTKIDFNNKGVEKIPAQEKIP